MKYAYGDLHRMGYAHSVETWLDGKLVGGLYGVALGRVFFGESMFSHVSNASKVAFNALVEQVRANGFWLVDCQQDTPHMRSLGATTVSAVEFYDIMRKNQMEILKGSPMITSGIEVYSSSPK
jgi:leucyl/phenylalanyl-tRNA--protein transferase